jgi:hypothetical protein
MKLSELVAYRTQLDDLTPTGTEDFIKSKLGSVIHVVDNHSLQFPELSTNLHHAQQQVTESFSMFQRELCRIKQELSQSISSLQPHYLAESYKLYGDMRKDSTEYILGRRITLNVETQSFIQSRVQYYSNWHHAGMIIRPANEIFMEHMVACDPLYVIDQSHDLLSPTRGRFNSVYQSRLRFYVVQENAERPMLEQIPNGQIGFCMAFNFFHFKPFEIMRAYLTEIHQKLRPGGVMAFTFNDCDRVGAVKNAENFFMCYTPGYMLQSLCESLGFVMRYRYEVDAATTWMELEKPGTKPSLRGGQALAELKPK